MDSKKKRAKGFLARLFASNRGYGYGLSILPITVGLMVVLFLWAALTVFQATDVERSARERAFYTAGVMGRLNAVYQMTLDVENARRGYLLTQDRAYLEPYAKALRERPDIMDTLAVFADDQPGSRQEKWLIEIDRLVDSHFMEVKESINLVRDDRRADAIALLGDDVGQQRLERLRQVIDSYSALEDAQMSFEREAAEKSERLAGRRLILTAVALALLVAILSYLVWRNVRMLKTEADLIEANEAREQVELISRELNHRVKNLFSIVISIISLTGRRENDVETAVEKTRERVQALASAHQLTIGGEGSGPVNLDRLIDTVFAPHASKEHAYDCRGCEVEIPTRAITPIGLTLHELATNAVKYGAWSHEEGGRILVELKRPDGDSDADYELVWRESGGPQVTRPDEDQRGFGSTMIAQGLRALGGSIEIDWRPDGLVAHIFFSLPEEPGG